MKVHKSVGKYMKLLGKLSLKRQSFLQDFCLSDISSTVFLECRGGIGHQEKKNPEFFRLGV